MNGKETISMGVEPNRLIQDREDEVVIDIKALLQSLGKKWWLIIIIGIIGVLIGYISVDQTIITSYSGSVTMCVTSNPGEDKQLSVSDVTAADKLIPNYMQLIRNSQVLEKIAITSGTDYDGASINRMLSINAVENTNIFKIIVSGYKEEEVSAIANAIVQTVPEALMSILPVGDIWIIDNVELISNVNDNNLMKNTAIGGMLGILLVCLIVCGLELLRNPIRDEKDLERTLGIASLGSVPAFKISNKNIKRLEKKNVDQISSSNLPIPEPSQDLVM